MKKKKILIIHSSLNGGGAEKVLIDILRNFDYNSYDVSLFLLSPVGTYMNEIPHQVHLVNGKLRKFPHCFMRIMVMTNIWGMSLRHDVRKIFADKYFDTIISFMEGQSAKCHSYLFDKGKKNISWVHTDLLSNHWSKLFFPIKGEEKRFYTNLTEIVFVSKMAQESFCKLFNLPSNEGKVIYNLIDRNDICSKANNEVLHKTKFTVCNVGRLTKLKRQDKIIKIAAILKEEGYDIDFWILGQGELENTLKEMCKKEGVENMVHFLGFKRNPYSYIKFSDVFLLTSDIEGFPLVVSEALCLGKPIVSTNITGPIEQLDNGKYGIITSRNVIEITNALKQLIDNPTLLKSYAQKAEYRGKTFFDVQQVMQQIYNIL